jgi:hypothetical protein
MVCTSPPYYGLRDYGTGTWEGGNPACTHVVGEMRRGLGLAASAASTRGGGHKAAETADIQAKELCPHCGARRVDSQIGLEPTPDAYVAEMVAVFREVRRVLRPDGCVFLNLGDSYYRTPTTNVPQTKNKRVSFPYLPERSLRAAACDTSDKEPEDSPDRGCLCGSLCDACRAAYRIGKSHNGIQRAPPTSPRPAGRTCGC